MDGGWTARSFVLIQLFAVLIGLGWFKRATIASLIPGHTHVDVDTIFSVFRRALASDSYKANLSWPELLRVLQHAYPSGSEYRLRFIEWAAQFKRLFHHARFNAGVRIDNGAGVRTVAIEKDMERPCRHPDMVGLFGKGTETGVELTKPHVFNLWARDEDGCVVVDARYSAADDSKVSGARCNA